jgi:signal transduction histidine kinase
VPGTPGAADGLPGNGARVSVPPAEVMVSVTDDGTGIPDELAAAPFEPARRRRTRTSGAGLGLSIAQGIVDAHGGRIELQRLPKGTRFRVFLPVEAAEPLPGLPDLRETGHGTGTAARHPVSVPEGNLGA